DPSSKRASGTAESRRKVKGTLQWVSIKHAIEVDVREHDRRFTVPEPDRHGEQDGLELANPEPVQSTKGYREPSEANAKTRDHMQFQRLGYFNIDPDSTNEILIFNTTVGLRDTWAKLDQ